MNPSGIAPLDVKVLIQPDRVEEKTAGGIFIPDTTKDREKYATVRGIILATGENAFADWGDARKPSPGDRVVTAQYAGVNIKGLDGEEYRLVNDEDVISLLEAGR
jgi:chaperonin GroES